MKFEFEQAPTQPQTACNAKREERPSALILEKSDLLFQCIVADAFSLNERNDATLIVPRSPVHFSKTYDGPI